jgi:hypothetical protein
MKSYEKVYKKLLELRRDRKSLRRLLGHVSGPAEAEVNEGYDKAIHQIEILEWVLKEKTTESEGAVPDLKKVAEAVADAAGKISKHLDND